MGLCPAPVNGWPLAWIALVPLWWAIARLEKTWQPGVAFRLGLLWSLAYHGIVLSWITALHPLTWMGLSWGSSVAIAAFAWGFITGLGGLTFGLWGLLWHSLTHITRDRPGAGLRRLLLGVALWCALETVLSWGPLHWPTLAFTQSPANRWILHLGQLSGPMAVTAAIVAVNGCWAEAWLAAPTVRGAGAASARLTRGWWWVALSLGVALHGVGGILLASAPADQPDQGLTLGLIQGNVPTRIKLTPEGIRRAARSYAAGYRDLVTQGAEAVLTPEGALPEIWRDRTQQRNPIYQAVTDLGRVLWLGTFRPVETPQGFSLTQSLVTLDGNAQILSHYDKIKLVPLGEYIPFQRVLGGLISRLSPVEGSLVPGQDLTGLATPWGRAIVGICYESAYSDLFRQQAAAGGEWIMTASNNDPYPPHMMRQHHAQDVMRAIETDRWSMRVTNTGISGVVDPRGRTRWLSPPNVYALHLDTLYRRQTRTPYVRWGDRLTPLLLILSAIACVFPNTSRSG
jgi:apolipoprotein N-acyltransferase